MAWQEPKGARRHQQAAPKRDAANGGGVVCLQIVSGHTLAWVVSRII